MAVARLLSNTEKLVAQIVFKMISDPEEKKDIVQDIYLKTFKHLPDLKHQCKLSTWIAQITYYTCFNYLKKHRPLLLKIDVHENVRDLPPVWSKISRSNTNAFELLMAKERESILEKHIGELPPTYRVLLTLFHKEELSLEEIATITGLPIGTIKNYLFRARKALKERLLRHYLKEDL